MFVFYSHLLQILTNQVNSLGGTPIPSTSTAKIESLESLIILLANDINFDKVEIVNNSLKNLIDLMIALLKNDHDYVLPDELFNESFDCLLVNECLEFARFNGKRYNQRLLLRKLEFAFELFDYGFVNESVNYCELILKRIKNADFDLKKIVSLDGTPFKASKLQGWLVPKLSGIEEDDVQDMITKLWSYQIIKLLSRNDQISTYDSPLIVLPPDPEPSSEEESTSEDNSSQELSEESEESEPEPVKPIKQKKEKNSSKKAVMERNLKQEKERQKQREREREKERGKKEKKEMKVATLSLDNKKKNKDKVDKKAPVKKRSASVKEQQSQSDSRATSRTDNDDSRDDLLEEPSFSTQLSSTVEQDQSGQMNSNDLSMSPIELNRSRNVTPLRESMITSHSVDAHQKSLPDLGQQFIQNSGIGSPFGNQRSLNSIAESRLEDSQNSTPASSLTQSPQKAVPHHQLSPQSSFDFSNTSAPSNFNISGPFATMNTLEHSLPNGDLGISQVDSGPQSLLPHQTQQPQPPMPMPQQHQQQQQQQSQPAPPPPMFTPQMNFDNSAPVLDFLSTGQVMSIPTFDTTQMENFNPNAPAGGNQQQNNDSNSRPEARNDDQKKNETGSNKNSPSKNGGIFSSLLGKFKCKFYFRLLSLRLTDMNVH